MNTIHEIIGQLAPIQYPSWAAGGTGFALLLAAIKSRKGLLKVLLGILPLAALAGAVWWHLRQ